MSTDYIEITDFFGLALCTYKDINLHALKILFQCDFKKVHSQNITIYNLKKNVTLHCLVRGLTPRQVAPF